MKLLKVKQRVTAFFAVLSALFFLGSQAVGAQEGFWKTQGSRIINTNGQTVVIKGVNWFGLETEAMTPHGLWSRNYKEMIDQIKSLGFNTIRLPYSNQALEANAQTSGIDFGKNRDLVNLKPIEIMDKVVDYAGSVGLKIILDRHRPEAWGQSDLWYTDKISEQRWISDWQMLAQRYANNSAVIGADLHNEPHGAACWGCGNASVDWKEAATRAGNAILSVNPNWLIIVEGVEQDENQWYWWGGNLRGAATKPIKLNVEGKLVYSTHDYPNSVHTQSWLNDVNFPSNLEGVWDRMWGYLAKSGQTPVLVGEFGTKLETESDKLWLAKLTQYMNNNGISWTFWSFNPNSGDTGGILADDWVSVRQDKMNYLSPLIGSQPQSSNVVPTSTITNAALPSSSQTQVTESNVRVSYTTRDGWNNGYVMDMVVENNTQTELVGWKVEWNKDSGQTIGERWGATGEQGPGWATAMGVNHNQNLAPGAKTSFGMVINFSGANPPFTNIRVITQNQAVTPTPTPTITLNPTSTGSGIEIWWPMENTPVSGSQPIKAIVTGKDINSYKMTWQVDGGVSNTMETNLTDSPHKEAIIDFSGWNWRGNGPYTMEVTAISPDGTVIGKKTFNLTLNR